MRLEVLNINFKNRDELMSDIRGALFEGEELAHNKKEITFDSIDTFKRVISQNKLQVLMAISQLKPDSIYQLEKYVGRSYPHVLKDCRQLESLGFINLREVESAGGKKQVKPELIFEYDLIKVNAKMLEVFPISERSNRIILEEANAAG